MKGDKKAKHFTWQRIVFVVVIVLLLVAIWYFFFNYENCTSWTCFNDNLEKCDRTKFYGGSDMIFQYVIKGSSGGDCRVDVKLMQGELSNQDSLKLEGRSMTCLLPKGVVMIPESNIVLCSGPLKEGLQDLVIKKLHTYLVQNLGRLNLEMADLPVV